MLLLALLACRADVESAAPAAPSTVVAAPVSVGALEFSARPRNLVLLTIDTARRDRFNRYGYDTRFTTPVLDGLMRDGVVLDEHHSCSSWTYPSLLCALTGRDQRSMRFFPVNTGGPTAVAPQGLTFLAETLAAVGMHTALFSTNAYLGPAFGMSQGYHDIQITEAHDAADTADHTLELLEAVSDPFFVHAHFIDPHWPYVPPSETLDGVDALPACVDGDRVFDLSRASEQDEVKARWDELSEGEQVACLERLQARYDGSLRYVDDQIGRIVDEMEDRGLFDDTLLVVLTDHGEEVDDHGLFGHGHSGFEELTRAVAVFYQPSTLAPAAVASPTTHEDLLPTLSAVFDAPVPESVTGGVVGTVDRAHVFNLTFREEGTHQSVTRGTDKLIFRWDCREASTGPKHLYDLEADPSEEDNLYDPEDPTVVELWELLEPEIAAVDALEPGHLACPTGP